MKPRGRFEVWAVLWSVGVALWFVCVPALLGIMAGERLESEGAPNPLPWRLMFVAVAVGIGGWLAWRVVTGPQNRRRTKRP